MTTSTGIPGHRVVVTGLGSVTPIGVGTDTYWSNLRDGVCGVGPIENFDPEDLYITIGAEVRNFNARPYFRDLKREKIMPHADRFAQFAGVAAIEAMEMAGLSDGVPNPLRAGCIIGSGAGGLVSYESAYRDLFIHKKKATHPLTLLRIIGSSACAHVSIEFNIKGPTFGTVSACSTAAHAIGLTFDMIRRGVIDMAVTGASEGVMNYGTMRAWQALRVLSPDGCRPFSKDRNGTVLAEGAGLLVLESLEHAQARGATILGEVCGFGMTSDAKDMVNPDTDGAAEAMRLAIADAGLDPSQIGYVNAHGTATAINDSNETKAIRQVFGDHADKLAVSSTKSMHGHLLGAGGGIEAIACLKALQDQHVPATINLNETDPECDLDYVPNQGRDLQFQYAVSNSFAFGGLNSVLVLGAAPA
ncbi:MAG: beta-ketoacyl-[acyl-carrier-protein] synthase family protein [Pseudomonadota bacterium]